MIQAASHYTDLRGRNYDLADLDREERELVSRFQEEVTHEPDWHEFENKWRQAVRDFHRARGVAAAEMTETAVYRIAADLAGRLMVAQGLARAPDYRDELQELIRERFKSQRAFCEATGISEDMLSHVLARRKHLAIDTLEKALARIGCTLRIVPNEPSAAEKK